MRIRPDGAELLRAAREVIEAVIVPELADDRRAAAAAIAETLALGEDRLARDVAPSAAELAALEGARVAIRGELYAALPEERRYDARLIAKAIAVAKRQLENGHVPERREYERLSALLGTPAAAPASSQLLCCDLAKLNGQLAGRIRAGEADVGTTAYPQTLAHLEAITQEALSESNPAYLRRTEAAPPAEAAGPPARPATARPASARPVASALAAWVHLNGAFGQAVCASGTAALTKQADLFGWFAQRLAANARVPMAAVEGAHQAHDLAVSMAEANAELGKLFLAPLRCLEAHTAQAARCR